MAPWSALIGYVLARSDVTVARNNFTFMSLAFWETAAPSSIGFTKHVKV